MVGTNAFLLLMYQFSHTHDFCLTFFFFFSSLTIQSFYSCHRNKEVENKTGFTTELDLILSADRICILKTRHGSIKDEGLVNLYFAGLLKISPN